MQKHQHLSARSSLCHIPLVHSRSGRAGLNSKHAKWAFIKPLFSTSPPGVGLPAACIKVIIPQTSVFPLKLWHLKPCTNWCFYLSAFLMSDCKQTRLIKSLSFWLANNGSNQSPVIMLNVQKMESNKLLSESPMWKGSDGNPLITVWKQQTVMHFAKRILVRCLDALTALRDRFDRACFYPAAKRFRRAPTVNSCPGASFRVLVPQTYFRGSHLKIWSVLTPPSLHLATQLNTLVDAFLCSLRFLCYVRVM